MHTPSIRTLAALAYERGEELDPATMLTPALMDVLSIAAVARPIVPGPATVHRRAAPQPEERSTNVGVPDWFSACDLLDPPIAGTPVAVVHGEPL
jgi:hypothetical protein